MSSNHNKYHPIQVLVVDDSAFIREVMTSMLNSAEDIEVIGTARDPLDAREKIKKLKPDVITLDIEMPKMDGLSFLEKIMTLRPMPVVMVSTLTQKGAEPAIKALELGAVDCVGKPTQQKKELFDAVREEIVNKVRAASRAKIRPLPKAVANATQPTSLEYRGNGNALIAIGSSTGGVEALREIIPYMPANCPPILITQHMSASFTASFAKRLDGLSAITVVEAEDGMPIQTGHAYLAPGGKHLQLKKTAARLSCQLNDGEEVSGHKPSVDVMFASFRKQVPTRTVACILTGMGKDGAQEMLTLREAGARTVGQDEDSCVVYGMPRAASVLGAVEKELPLSKIAAEILSLCQ